MRYKMLMRFLSVLLAGASMSLLCLGFPASLSAIVWHVPASGDGTEAGLQEFIDRAGDGDTILLGGGIFRAAPRAFIDSLCGNCEEHRTPVNATAGFVVSGKGLVIIGTGRGTVLETGAGYGVYFDRSYRSFLQEIMITKGVRDPDGRATDAAVVARRSNVTVNRCFIEGNTARVDSIVVGIGGIFGREGSRLFITNNEIRNNGWDGVALYRGASAIIENNVIAEGRGAGVGITWDASAVVRGNRISGYWKGIGAFGESRVNVYDNIVFDNLGWGIIATGASYLEAAGNVVLHNGNCGLAVWSGTCTGRFTNNIVARNGWRKEWVCPCVGMYVESKNDRFEISYNDIWGNEAGGYAGVDDLTGVNGNVSIDPGISAEGDFKLTPGSPLIDAGNPLIIDRDGSRSDIGRFWNPPLH